MDDDDDVGLEGLKAGKRMPTQPVYAPRVKAAAAHHEPTDDTELGLVLMLPAQTSEDADQQAPAPVADVDGAAPAASPAPSKRRQHRSQGPANRHAHGHEDAPEAHARKNSDGGTLKGGCTLIQP